MALGPPSSSARWHYEQLSSVIVATTPETFKSKKMSSSDFISEEKTKAETVSGIFPIVDVCLVNICDCKLEEQQVRCHNYHLSCLKCSSQIRCTFI